MSNKERAMQLLDQIPESEMYYIIRILEHAAKSTNTSKSMEGLHILQSFAGTLPENLDYKYERIIYWSDDDNAFIVEVPELPGCMTDGETIQEAIANTETIIEEWIEAAKEHGFEIPETKGRLIK